MNNREDLNLGWLAGRQSGVPQKIKAIEGVSRTSALDLKAQTEKVKGLAQSIKDGSVEPGERRKRGIDLASLGPSNSGVREREERDRLLHVKEVSKAALRIGPHGLEQHCLDGAMGCDMKGMHAWT